MTTCISGSTLHRVHRLEPVPPGGIRMSTKATEYGRPAREPHGRVQPRPFPASPNPCKRSARALRLQPIEQCCFSCRIWTSHRLRESYDSPCESPIVVDDEDPMGDQFRVILHRGTPQRRAATSGKSAPCPGPALSACSVPPSLWPRLRCCAVRSRGHQRAW